MKVADSTKARIYLIRPDPGSKMASTKISDNGILIGNTGPRGYLCWERQPGRVRVTSLSSGEAAAELTVEAGSAYYIVQRVDPGWVYGKSSLAVVPEEKGQALLKSCKPAYVTDAETSSGQARTAMESIKPTRIVTGGSPSGGGSAGGITIIIGAGGH
jgi:hypothetical protein